MQSKNSLYIYNVYSSLAVIWRSIFDSHVCFPRWLRCSAVVSRRTIGLWVINKHGGCPPWNNQKFKHRLQNFSCSRKCSTTKYLIWLVEKVLCWRKEFNYKISLASVELGISSAREHERKTSMWEFGRVYQNVCPSRGSQLKPSICRWKMTVGINLLQIQFNQGKKALRYRLEWQLARVMRYATTFHEVFRGNLLII